MGDYGKRAGRCARALGAGSHRLDGDGVIALGEARNIRAVICAVVADERVIDFLVGDTSACIIYVVARGAAFRTPLGISRFQPAGGFGDRERLRGGDAERKGEQIRKLVHRKSPFLMFSKITL